jgi:hypothetical protein
LVLGWLLVGLEDGGCELLWWRTQTSGRRVVRSERSSATRMVVDMVMLRSDGDVCCPVAELLILHVCEICQYVNCCPHSHTLLYDPKVDPTSDEAGLGVLISSVRSRYLKLQVPDEQRERELASSRVN